MATLEALDIPARQMEEGITMALGLVQALVTQPNQASLKAQNVRQVFQSWNM